MLAKCGDVKVWHWAHVAAEGCDWEPGGETDWHLSWKASADPSRQEVALNGHRADVISPGGIVVELQHSHLSQKHIEGREKAYRHMVWLFDAREAREAGRLVFYRHPDRAADDLYRNMKWDHAPAFTTQVKATMFLDLGDEGLIWVGKWYEDRPRRGYGWLVTAEWFRNRVINGAGLPKRPQFGKTITEAELTASLLRPRPTPLVLDWSDHKLGRMEPCWLCSEPALLRDTNGRPCHKACAEVYELGEPSDEAAADDEQRMAA